MCKSKVPGADFFRSSTSLFFLSSYGNIDPPDTSAKLNANEFRDSKYAISKRVVLPREAVIPIVSSVITRCILK